MSGAVRVISRCTIAGRWKKVLAERDPFTGETRQRMLGEAISNAVT